MFYGCFESIYEPFIISVSSNHCVWRKILLFIFTLQKVRKIKICANDHWFRRPRAKSKRKKQEKMAWRLIKHVFRRKTFSFDCIVCMLCMCVCEWFCKCPIRMDITFLFFILKNYKLKHINKSIGVGIISKKVKKKSVEILMGSLKQSINPARI